MLIVIVPYTPEPSFAVAFAVTIPLSAAVTRPELFIAASELPLTIDHVTDLSVAFEGRTVSWS